MKTLDALTFHARVRPTELAIIHGRGSATFLQLYNMIVAVATRLRESALDPSKPVGIYVSDPLLHLALLLGLMREAIPSFSGDADGAPPPRGAVIETYLADRPLFAGNAAIMTVDASWLGPLQASSQIPEQRRFRDRRSLARIFASSGTTGIPEAIGLNPDLVDRRIDLPSMMGENRYFPGMSLNGFSSSFGFRTALAYLRLGRLQVMPSAQLDPLSAIKLYGVKSLAGSPAPLLELLDAVEREKVYLSSLEQVRVVGIAVPAQTMVRMRSRLCPNVVGAYGSAECGGVAEAPSELLQRIPGCAGYLHPWAQAEIVDDGDTPVAPGNEGHLRIRTAVAVNEYLRGPTDGKTAFRAGWFYPGDIGAMNSDGLLRITGRSTEAMNV